MSRSMSRRIYLRNPYSVTFHASSTLIFDRSTKLRRAKLQTELRRVDPPLSRRQRRGGELL